MRLRVAFAVGAVLLGLVVTAWLSPDSGPTVGLPPIPVPARPRVARTEPRPAPRPPPSTLELPTEELGEDVGFEPPAPRRPAPFPPIDRSQVFDADLRGLAAAAVTRREEMVACIGAYQSRTGDAGYEGRFTLKISVSPGSGAASTEIVNGPDDDDLRSCLDRTMADVHLNPPEHDFSMMWPVPMPAESP